MRSVLAASLHRLNRAVWLLVLTWTLAGSGLQVREPFQNVRRFTRSFEFDFAGWTLDALGQKFAQFSLADSGYLSPARRRSLVLEYFQLIAESDRIQGSLNEVFGDPSNLSPQESAAPLLNDLDRVRARQRELQPLVEAVLQEQVGVTLESLGLEVGGAPFPPVAFRFAQLPLALIVSPREVIQQEANVSLEPGLPLDEQIQLEDEVERDLDVSSLVVPVGGLGSYPTMIQQSASLAWVAEVISHEWTHNYLTLRPLGLRYSDSQDLRTMNETTASLLGKEVGRLVLAHYYPEFLAGPAGPGASLVAYGATSAAPPAFDFRQEMRVTRVQVDSLLEQGKVEEAEAYMEQRRQIFWDQGYHIRRLNQAYFAFYGAYAEEPGGAAGEDPVGAAVRDLWARIGDPAAFLRTMAWMSSVADLQQTLERYPTRP